MRIPNATFLSALILDEEVLKFQGKRVFSSVDELELICPGKTVTGESNRRIFESFDKRFSARNEKGTRTKWIFSLPKLASCYLHLVAWLTLSPRCVLLICLPRFSHYYSSSDKQHLKSTSSRDSSEGIYLTSGRDWSSFSMLLTSTKFSSTFHFIFSSWTEKSFGQLEIYSRSDSIDQAKTARETIFLAPTARWS